MEKTLLSTDEVKRALYIDNFRKISKDKIIEFVSLISGIDKSRNRNY